MGAPRRKRSEGNMSTQSQHRRLFIGCFLGLVATAFGFAVRGAALPDWETSFGLTEEQKGIISGVGLYPFAVSIILFSLVVDRIGYGTSMAIAFTGHVVSTALTIFAPTFEVLYIATFVYALSNGIVEAVINPVVATIYRENKTHWLNVLHAGWPGGLVLGGLLAVLVLKIGSAWGEELPGQLWQWKMAVLFIPILAYGLLLFGQGFPVQERVEAGVSYRTMLEEFGWGSAYIVSFLVIMAISQILLVFQFQPIDVKSSLCLAVIPSAVYGVFVRKFGRPIFVFLMLVMFLLSTTELGTDGWIQDIMGSVLQNEALGTLFLVYTSLIMFVLRFFAGPIVHRISPLGLLACSSLLATLGLLWLGNAGTSIAVLCAAATLYGFGKSFFWPTMLGVVSEQFPRGGALLLNAISGVGMISIGTLGATYIGTIQDRDFSHEAQTELSEVYPIVSEQKSGLFSRYEFVDKSKYDLLSDQQVAQLDRIERNTKQHALAQIAYLPAIMFICFLGLVLYYRSKGGYRAEVLAGHSADDEVFTGGTVGPSEA